MRGVGVVRVRTPTPGTVVVVRSEAERKSNDVSLPPHPLSLSKPSWVVRTQSNVRKLVRKKPDPPCVVCQGTGKVDCYNCSGKGRTNYTYLATLPKGEWPKWCNACGGSGLIYCSRCLGTGEYRYIIGFHFMKRDSDDINQQQRHIPRDKSGGQQAAADRFLQGDHLDLDSHIFPPP